jgi:hypothetical protein
MTYAVLSPSGAVVRHCSGKDSLAQALAIAMKRQGFEIWECVAGEPCYYLASPSLRKGS